MKRNMRSHLFRYMTLLLAVGIGWLSFAGLPPAGLDDDILAATNQFRRSRGKAVLQMREDLNAIARKHSENMAAGRVAFGHSGFASREAAAQRKVPGSTAFAENVAYGATSGKEVVKDWKESPGHRRNMLGTFRYIGIGTAKDKNGVIYYTQLFVN
ncbi:MAG: CAP domain-containing protein [Chitinophagaceae bacterium]|jgi:uncharacterized protein YkwD|nr:CAP domain-containing protein [Chitinophagaceae bacterium]